MGTRGAFGIRIDGEDKLAYNHFDSYPEGLGVDMLADVTEMLSDWGLEKMQAQSRKLNLIDGEVPPTPEQIKELLEFADLGVSNQSEDDWYCLLRNFQGKLRDTLTISYMEGSNNFICESLFCEWGYILNLDENVLEVYKGYQHEAHDKGRYSNTDYKYTNEVISSDYYPCALIITFPLDNLPTAAEFIIAINRAPFDSEAEMILHRFEDYGEISAEHAKNEYGIEDFDVIIENLVAAGHSIVEDDGTYELEAS